MKTKHILITAAAVAVVGFGIGHQFVTPPIASPAPIVEASPEFTSKVYVDDVSPKAGPATIYPNLVYTPGATNPDVTQATLAQNICNPQWSTRSIRPPVSVTTPMKKEQLASGYNFNGDMNTADYEEDHLISLELGGNPRDSKNLWPEPYHTMINGVEIGARQKDKVENYLHDQVCSHALTLDQAQAMVVQDWYSVYLKMKGLGGVTDANDGDNPL